LECSETTEFSTISRKARIAALRSSCESPDEGLRARDVLIGVPRLASSSGYARVYGVDECSKTNCAIGCCTIDGTG
jgi:hypothetical protein